MTGGLCVNVVDGSGRPLIISCGCLGQSEEVDDEMRIEDGMGRKVKVEEKQQLGNDIYFNRAWMIGWDSGYL
jgi:hypothetical protein